MLAVTNKTKAPIPTGAARVIMKRAFPRGSMEVSLVFVGDSAMRRLNRTYCHTDKTTDVLSFLLEPGLGEIVISIPEAAREAKAQGIGIRAQLCRLIAHGAAHLAGHDHARPRGRVLMQRLETKLVRGL